VVELGRHTILRGWRGDLCRFEYGLRHQLIKSISYKATSLRAEVICRGEKLEEP